MEKIKNTSSLLAKYTMLYKKNPRSRVFAPLAEAYRKLGMHTEALSILTEGIKNHPGYTLGYIVLGNCHFDQQKYELAFDTIKSFPKDNLENISLQKLYGNCCEKLGYFEEALMTYKCLLLLNPKNIEIAEKVKLLEDDLLLDDNDLTPAKKIIEKKMDDDDWVQVNFNEEDIFEVVEINEIKEGLEQFRNDIKNEQLEVIKHRLDDQYFFEDYDNKSDEAITADYDFEDTNRKESIITHTLVDLYCKQGHVKQAKEILRNILELHPTDEASLEKLKSLEIQTPKKSLDSPLEKFASVEDIYNMYMIKLCAHIKTKQANL